MNIYKALKEYKQFIIAAIFFSILGTGVTFALPYVPTDQELDPTCAPGDTDCYVSIFPSQTSNTGKLLFTDGTNPAWASNLYWDETNDRLGVGTSAPVFDIHITKTDPILLINSVNDTGASAVLFREGVSLSSVGYLQYVHSNFATANRRSAVEISSLNGPIAFRRAAGEVARFDTSNNFLIGNTTGVGKINVWGSGSTSSTYTAQFHNSTGTSNSLVIRDDGRVGIGTNSPGSELHVVASDGIGAIRLEGSDEGQLQLGATGAPTGTRNFNIRSDDGNMIFGVLSDDWSSYLATPMIIEASGDVGIGTLIPSFKLDVLSGAVAARFSRNEAGLYPSTRANVIRLNNPNAINGTYAGLSFTANDTGGTERIAVDAGALITDHSVNAISADFVVLTTLTGTTDEKFRITSSGNVGIGTIAPASRLHVGVAPTASANYGLVSLGNGAFDGSTSGFFTGSASGTTLAINNASGYAGDLLNIQVAGASKLRSTSSSFTAQGSGSVNLATFTRTDAGEARLTIQGYAPSSIPAVQFIANNFNGVDYTPVTSGSTIGRIFARGPINTAGTYSAIGSPGVSFVASETWNASAYGSRINFSVTKTGTTVEATPLSLNNTTNNVLITGFDTTSASAALSVTNSSAANLLYVRNDGRIGMGTNAPSSDLSIARSNTNDTTTSGLRLDISSTSSLSGSYNTAGIYNLVYKNVNSGVVDSGSLRGSYTEAFRNMFGSGDSGTLSFIFGDRILYGHLNNDVLATPTTTNAFGIYVYPFIQSGTITNAYDIYISAPNGASTITKHWGMFQAASTASNFFAGNVGIGINAPTDLPAYRLDVKQDSASTYATRIFHDGNATTRWGLLIQSGLDDHTAAGPSTLIAFQDGDGTAVGSITFGSSATAYNTTSDQRMKNLVNEQTLSSINILKDIKIHDFTWKDDTNNNLYTGVFAQELYEVYPFAVTKPVNDEDKWMVDYSKLTPIIIASVQELNTNLTSLDPTKPNSLASLIKEYLGDALNGLERLFVKEVRTERICVDDITCLTTDDIRVLIDVARNNQPAVQNNPEPTPTPDPDSEPEPTPEPEPVVEDIVEEPAVEEVVPEPEPVEE